MGGDSKTFERGLRLGLVVSACVLSTACAGLKRASEFKGKGDAKVLSDGQIYTVTLHPREASFMLLNDEDTRRASIVAMGPPLERLKTPRPWRRAAETFLKPTGCQAVEVKDVLQHFAWEVTYACPPGVDLHGLIAAQRTRLLEGEPLEAPGPR